jgi:hypothetical protein
VSLESSQWGGVHGLGPTTFRLPVQKFFNIEWCLHWNWNQIVAENFGGSGMCFWCCRTDLDEQDLMEFIWLDLESEFGRYWFWSGLCCWKFK